jgi:ribonuclease R
MRAAAGRTSRKRTVTGKLTLTSRGFGFVLVPGGPDLFVPLESLSTALDGDTVKAEIVREVEGRNPVGRIVEVLERATTEVVGVFSRKDGAALVVPEDERMRRPLQIPRQKEAPGPKGRPPENGQIVLARLEAWTDPAENPEGRVLEILGFPDEPGMDLRIIARSKGLKTAFPKDVEEQARRLRPADMAAEARRREDLRGLACFTIDPENAKDFDDAVSLAQREDGLFELGVHIADVSHYVPEGTPLDREARERATSAYFVQEVIPMLPERLSNELCSLRPEEDRLAFSVLMTIDSRGEVRDHRIVESIIRSRRRFTYREVERIIDGEAHPHAAAIHLMMLLSLVLRRGRERMGSIDFDTSEQVFSLDENGIPVAVRPAEKLDANRLVEEFMLAANRTVARHIIALREGKRARPGPGGPRAEAAAWPFIFRVHEKPKEEDARAFLGLLASLGIQYRVPGELQPEDFRKLLAIIENLEFSGFVERVALRSMAKAVYSTGNMGHFGLAFDAYTHFTSPIRRYPDLEVHRLLKRYAGKGRPRDPARLEGELRDICENSTNREVRANEAEREYARLKSMEFLARKIGKTYDGVITGVTSFGVFVEITHFLIEGLVHISEMKDDSYVFDKESYQLVGQASRRVYRLGDRVRVRIKRVSIEERKADFQLVATR